MFKNLKKKSPVAIFAIALSLTSIAHADYSEDQNSNDPSTNNSYSNNAVKSNVSDQELTKKIRDKIGSGWFSKGYDQVNFQVNNGAVNLQGSVKTEADKEKVEKEIRNLDGVRSLNSQITVQEPTSKDNQKKTFSQDSSATSADDQLNKRIRDNVSRGWLWNSYKDVSLNTSNGIVTLEGFVDNLSDQQKLIGEIQKVDGVRSVKSNLNIKNQ